MERKRILVTGEAGFLGSHLCDRLIEQGNDVTEPLYVEVDQIYNLACPASPIHYQYDPIKTGKTSVIGALNSLGLAKRVKARILPYMEMVCRPEASAMWMIRCSENLSLIWRSRSLAGSRRYSWKRGF